MLSFPALAIFRIQFFCWTYTWRFPVLFTPMRTGIEPQGGVEADQLVRNWGTRLYVYRVNSFWFEFTFLITIFLASLFCFVIMTLSDKKKLNCVREKDDLASSFANRQPDNNQVLSSVIYLLISLFIWNSTELYEDSFFWRKYRENMKQKSRIVSGIYLAVEIVVQYSTGTKDRFLISGSKN